MLLVGGGGSYALSAIQSGAISMALPFVFILIAATLSLLRVYIEVYDSKKWKIYMEDNHLEEALVAIRRVMRATEINSLSLAKKSPAYTNATLFWIIANKKHTRPSHISILQR